MKKFVIIFIALLCLFSTVYATDENTSLTLKAKVIEVGEPYDEVDEYSSEPTRYQDVTVRITDDTYNGTIQNIKYCLSYYMTNDMVADKLNIGDDVYVYLDMEDGKIISSYIQYVDKQNLLTWIIIIYAASILLLGGMKGVKALVSLIITIAAIGVMIYFIYIGYNPLLITILASVFSIIVTLVIVAGFSKKTVSAIIGTSAGIIVAGLFAIIFGNLMKLSGIGEESLMLSTVPGAATFDFKGIMFSGIIIGALGACMDVGMSISSAIFELKEQSPDMKFNQLFKSGMNIGKDIMGTMTNTLILAYVGSSITIILILIGFEFKFFEVINQEQIAQEILRAIAGSIGLVCTIPLTAFSSSVLFANVQKKKGEHNGRGREVNEESDN